MPSTSQAALSASPKASTRFPGSLSAFLRPSSHRRHARAPSGDECDNTKAVREQGDTVEGTRTATGRRRREHAATDECGGSSRKRRQDTANRARSDAGTRADGGDHDRANHGRPAATAAARMRRRRPVKRFDSMPPHTPSRRAPARPQERGDHARTSRVLAADVHEQDLTSMFIIPKTASSPHSTPLDDGLRAMRHPFDQLPSPIIPPLNPAISQQGEVLLMMRDLRRCAQHTTKCLVDDGTRERGEEEGECRFPSSKAVYTPLPRPGIDEEALDFEGGDPHDSDCTPRGRGALGAVESGGVGEDEEAGGMSRANRAPLSTFSASRVACATSRDTGKVFGGCGRGQQRRGAGWKGRDNARSRRRGGHLAVQ
uniref:Uncharacterized protein n=1 Tax=Schizophyllum commune (strain H4-8 / FGSC 9210) TaxID=578458 RepID=D8PXN7_SCHCM